ncbi:hypothetical protein MRB53_020809 [Persea americana]|uniref:Uncharacterized protein n=1 Tax=Persea americana TaxID=3435 RepID=A0ACC2L2A2_PERAE|nr:hypothetical protein MRB53_020809 [Persea americana]
MKKGQEIEKFKVKFDAPTITQEDDVNETMEAIMEEEGKVDIEKMDPTLAFCSSSLSHSQSKDTIVTHSSSFFLINSGCLVVPIYRQQTQDNK